MPSFTKIQLIPRSSHQAHSTRSTMSKATKRQQLKAAKAALHHLPYSTSAYMVVGVTTDQKSSVSIVKDITVNKHPTDDSIYATGFAWHRARLDRVLASALADTTKWCHAFISTIRVRGTECKGHSLHYVTTFDRRKHTRSWAELWWLPVDHPFTEWHMQVASHRYVVCISVDPHTSFEMYDPQLTA